MSNPTPRQRLEEDLLRQVTIWVCQPCLDGEKGECHYPGCIQWLRGHDERLDFEHQYEAANAQTVATLERVKKEHPIRGLVHRDLTSGKCDLCEYIDNEIKRIKEGK